MSFFKIENLLAEFRSVPGLLRSPSGTFDGFAVASGSRYFTNDVPPNATGVSVYLNNSGIGISNTCSTWDAKYTNTFDNKITNSFTVTCWAKGWPGGWNPWVSKYGEKPSGWQLRTDGTTPNYPCFTIRNNSVGTVTLGTAVYGDPDDMASRSIAIGNDGKWHHYAGTFDASQGIRCLYVDGELAASETGNAPCNLAAPNRLMLGARDGGSSTSSSGGYGNYFTGNLYDVRIYNNAAAQTQIRSIGARCCRRRICLARGCRFRPPRLIRTTQLRRNNSSASATRRAEACYRKKNKPI